MVIFHFVFLLQIVFQQFGLIEARNLANYAMGSKLFTGKSSKFQCAGVGAFLGLGFGILGDTDTV